MQGFQFGRIETWSRAGASKVNGKQPSHRKNGQRAWTVDQILNEVERLPSASEHVPHGNIRPLIWEGSCGSVSELRTEHEKIASMRVSFDYTDPKSGKKKVRRRKLRQDAHTLYTSVISLPILSADAMADRKTMSECLRALRIAKNFEQRRIASEGGDFALAVAHFDETFVHIHIFGLDRERGSVTALHPGKSAMERHRDSTGNIGSKGTQKYQNANRAYCNAMKEWQDDLNREVSQKIGLTRYGPKRKRLSRSGWKKQKVAEEARARSNVSLAQNLSSAKSIRQAGESIREVNNLLAEQGRLQEERDLDLRRRERDLDIQAESQERKRVQLDQQANQLNERERQNALLMGQTEQAVRNLEQREQAVSERENSADRKMAAALMARQDAVKCQTEANAQADIIAAMADDWLIFDEKNGSFKKAANATVAKEDIDKVKKALFDAPQAVRTIARKLSGALKRLHQNTREKAVEEAKAETADEFKRMKRLFDEDYNIGSSLFQFASTLIGRLPTRLHQDLKEQLKQLMDPAISVKVKTDKEMRRRNPRDDDCR